MELSKGGIQCTRIQNLKLLCNVCCSFNIYIYIYESFIKCILYIKTDLSKLYTIKQYLGNSIITMGNKEWSLFIVVMCYLGDMLAIIVTTQGSYCLNKYLLRAKYLNSYGVWPPLLYPTYPGGAPSKQLILFFSMYSLMSFLISASLVSNINSLRTLHNSV